jgi:hypothetical protein
MVNAGVESCISITPDKKHGRAYYMGTVLLSDVTFRIHDSGVKRAQAEQVRNVHAWAVGDLLSEQTEQYPPEGYLARSLVKVTYHYNVGRFITVGHGNIDVTDGHFRAAYVCGRDFYISKD